MSHTAASSIVSPTSAASSTATAAMTAHTTFNEALFLSTLNNNNSKPSHSQPFTFRRSFLSPPLSAKRATDGGDEKDKESVEGAVDVLRFGRHHPRRAELQGEWEEELIAQLQREEEGGEEKKAVQGKADNNRVKSAANTAEDESSASNAPSTTISTSTTALAPSASSFSLPVRPSTPTTPLSAADASLSSVLHLLAADNDKSKQPTLPERICHLLTAAISFHATLMQHFTSHVLQPPPGQQPSDNNNTTTSPALSASAAAPSTVADDKLAAVKQEEQLSTVPQFAAKYTVELTGSLQQLREADALLNEWKKDVALSTSDLTACDSLLTHVITPLSATFTSLLSPNPSLTSVASPSSLVASFLLAKRGRGRLHKCDKHRRWKKKCPADCPDKPQGKWDDTTPMDDEEEDAEDEEDEEEERVRRMEQVKSTEQTSVTSEKKRKLDGGHDRGDEQPTTRVQSTAKRAHEVVKAVHAFQPIATATAITPTSSTAAAATSVSSPNTPLPSAAASPPPTREEVVRAREAAMAAQVIPSALPLSSVSPMPHGAQMVAHPVARPASLPSTQSATLYAAQPLLLQSAMSARTGLPPNTLYTFASANQLTPSLQSTSFSQQPPSHTTHTLVTLEQLTAMQQQGNTFRIVQSTQPPLAHSAPHTQTTTAAYAQPYIPPQMSVVYATTAATAAAAAGVSIGQAAGGQSQSYTFSPVGGYHLQQQ